MSPENVPKHTDRVVRGIVLGAAIVGTAPALALIVLVLWYFLL